MEIVLETFTLWIDGSCANASQRSAEIFYSMLIPMLKDTSWTY